MRIFDVASPGEFEAVRAASPDAEMLYMHPVKAQSDIRLALETYGIRVMSLDHEDEIAKVLRIVRALDLDPGSISIYVRLQTKGHAMYELSKKFGAAPGHAVELVQRLHKIGFKVGLCFHVGSQVEEARILRAWRSSPPTGCATAPAWHWSGLMLAAASLLFTAMIRTARPSRCHRSRN